MKIKILGSGGCVSLPRPCCTCEICKEARQKGIPYARTGCSLFIEGPNVLIDTPEDINYALNNGNVNEVNYILYSHIDPDHTMGMRVLEQLRMDWLRNSIGIKNDNAITVATLPEILEDLKCQGTKFGSALSYYEECGLARLCGTDTIRTDSLEIKIVSANAENSVAIFVIIWDDKKVIYAPCDVKPFPSNELFYDADILIIGNTIVGDVLKDGFLLEKDNPLRNELFVLEEIVEIKDKYRIGSVIITHLEEDWGKSYDDYLQLEKQLDGIQFAFDGMVIE